MSAGTSTDATSPVTATGSAFLRDLTGLLRAGDAYGRLDGAEPERLLRRFLTPNRTAEEIMAMPEQGSGASCTVDARALDTLRLFYQAVAAGVERVGHVVTAVSVDVNHEGFGRALVTAGRLVLVADPQRDAGRFGFPTLAAVAAAGDRLVAEAVGVLDRYPEVAGDD